MLAGVGEVLELASAEAQLPAGGGLLEDPVERARQLAADVGASAPRGGLARSGGDRSARAARGHRTCRSHRHWTDSRRPARAARCDVRERSKYVAFANPMVLMACSGIFRL